MLALITGASSGLGEAFARSLAADGWDLVITARRGDRMRALADDLTGKHDVSVTVHVADLTVPGDLAGLEQAIVAAGPDMLVNNAGFAGYREFRAMYAGASSPTVIRRAEYGRADEADEIGGQHGRG